ncbi:hypothetical protein [Mangrovimonas futianensis]|uniref:hypothetical protein n=1 Tax=Mangrovimonas futianensis TaxID=2895523 RepID=UPI001E374FE2|nr:hypothetical protein [Mangrovimonas futianensis]MCF1421028.1 hypothetical protein [Mangrovimonas futianensis]
MHAIKYFLVVLAISFLGQLGYAQDQIKLEGDPPQILLNLKFGETMEWKGYQLQFMEVKQDSRCPKGVNCISPGEAIVVVKIFKEGVLLEEKSLMISYRHFQDDMTQILDVDGESLHVQNLKPYPVDGVTVKDNDRCLQVIPVNE